MITTAPPRTALRRASLHGERPACSRIVFALVIAGFAGLGGGCPLAPAPSSTCLDDDACGVGDVCAFGLCIDVDDSRLDTVDLDVEPLASTGVLAQAVFGVDARSDDDVRVDVVLRPATTLSGTAVLDDGGPVSGVVTATPVNAIAGRLRLPVTESIDGQWSLPLVQGDSYRVAVIPVDAAVAPAVAGADVLAGVDAGVALVSCHLPRNADEATSCPVVVSGRVVAGGGAAARGVPELEARIVDATGRRISTLARTGEDGSFLLGLPAPLDGGYLELRPSADNAVQPVLRRPLDLTGTTIDLGLITQGDRADTLALAGRVFAAGGAPAPGATVAVHGLVGAGEFAARATTDVDGSFTLAVRPGRYTVAALGAVDGADGLVLDEVVVDAAVSDLTLTLPPRTPVALRIVDGDDGDAVAAASVELQRVGDSLGVAERPLAGAQPSFVAATDEDGDAVLRVALGRYRVTIQPPRDAGLPVFSAVLVVDGAIERELVLPDAGILAGAVADPSGGATSGAVVRVYSPLVDELGRAIYLGEALTAADGSFTIAVPDLGR